MKLALLYHQFITRGGLEGYLRQLASELQTAGHELLLVTSRIEESLRPCGAEVRLIPPALTRRGTLARFAQRSAALVPDLPVDAVLGFGRTWRQDIHRAGGGCHWHYSKMLPWWKRCRPKNQLELDLERRLYTSGQTRHFVVNSAKVRQELAEAYQVPEDRVTVIRTAVDTSLWHPAPDPATRSALRQRLGIPDDSPALLFVSLDHRRKGLGTLLRALPQVPGARLYIAGQSLDAWRPLIQQLGLTSRITGLGRTDLLPWYQAADWFVHPTHYDACANTVLQSLACGLPGLISTADGAAEFITAGTNGTLLHHPSDPEELAAELNNAIQQTGTGRPAMSHAARQTMLPLTWQAHLADWMSVIKSTT